MVGPADMYTQIMLDVRATRYHKFRHPHPVYEHDVRMFTAAVVLQNMLEAVRRRRSMLSASKHVQSHSCAVALCKTVLEEDTQEPKKLLRRAHVRAAAPLGAPLVPHLQKPKNSRWPFTDATQKPKDSFCTPVCTERREQEM